MPTHVERLLPASCRRGNRSAIRSPHIAVLMADDLGFADTGYAGSPLMRTPCLDSLARHAVHLTRFRTPTWCAPSRAAFLTGRRGWELGLATAQGWTALGGEVVLLSQLLREAGYRTAIVGKFHFNPAMRRRHPSGGAFGCGFDHQHGFLSGETDYYRHHPTWSRDGKRVRERGYATELFAAEAERLILAHARRPAPLAPFFLWLALNAPHTPLQAPRELEAHFSASLDPQVRTYAAMVLAMDRAFERTVGALRQAGMFASALIAFMSDNGGPSMPVICNGGLRGGKGTPFEGGVRAPAFVYWPACLGRAQRVSAAEAHMVDWLATLAEAAVIGHQEATQQRLLRRVKHRAPHSLSLWSAIAESVPASASSPSQKRRRPPLTRGGGALERRPLVLEVAASVAGVLRGRWKLVLAPAHCLDPEIMARDHEQSIRGLATDRYLLQRLALLNGSRATVHGGGAQGASSGRARLEAARRPDGGVQLQLFDLQTDPQERTDLLGARADGNASGQWERTAASLLTHYLGAVRVARRATRLAYAEGRLTRGKVLKAWFCQQVFAAWDARRWERTFHPRTCEGRRGELGRLESVRARA